MYNFEYKVHSKMYLVVYGLIYFIVYLCQYYKLQNFQIFIIINIRNTKETQIFLIN